jgi:hypothetical protein
VHFIGEIRIVTNAHPVPVRGGAQMAQCECSYASERLLLTGRGMEVRDLYDVLMMRCARHLLATAP